MNGQRITAEDAGDAEVQKLWEKLRTGQCPYCANGESAVEAEDESVWKLARGSKANLVYLGTMLHIDVMHGDEALEPCVELWAAQIQATRYATANVKCPMPGCTFRAQVPTARAMPVLASHLRQSHGLALLTGGLVLLTPLLLMLWAWVMLLR